MIIAFDTETKGLGSDKPIICACITYDDYKTEYYPNGLEEWTSEPEYQKNLKSKIWNRILEIADKEAKRNKNLNAYAHNLAYDFFVLLDHNTPNIVYKSYTPLIIQKDKLYFLDTMRLINGSLKKVGEMVGLPKLDEDASKYETMTDDEIRERLPKIKEYCKRDTDIIIKAVKQIKNTMKTNGLNTKKLMTIGQIGINYTLQNIKQQPYANKIMQDQLTYYGGYEHKIPLGEFIPTKHREDIHKAVRGGRVQIFKNGLYHNVTNLDKKSMYPYCATKQDKFPDLTTEKKFINPLEVMTTNELFKHTGTATILLKHKKKDLGTIPTRYKGKEEYPNHECFIYGTYTLQEIEKWVQEGDKIIDIDQTTIYKNLGYNPLKELMQDLYKKRQQSDFEGKFFKLIMNNIIGKFAQRTQKFEVIKDSTEKINEYEQKGYTAVKNLGTQKLYKKDYGTQYPKFYCPIITANINALARLELYEGLKTIGSKNMLYCDTDSLLFEKNENYKKLKIGKELGDYEIKEENATALFYARKIYRINEDIKMSGANKTFLNKKDFDNGDVEYKRMLKIGKTNEIKKIGTFETIKINLAKKQEEEQIRKEEINETNIFIDELETDALKIQKTLKTIETYI